MDGSRVTFFAFGSRHTRPSIDDRGENCAFACDKVRPSHAFFAPLLEQTIPNFCARLFVWSHVMNLAVETDNLVDGQRQRPKSLQKEAFDSFDNMLLPTSRIMRAAREKNTQTSQRPPCPSSRSTVPTFASSESRWASLSPQVPHASSKPSILWPPRSVPQSYRLKCSRTDHLHRLQVASVASGLSQSVPLVSFMPVSVDPSLSSTIFGLLYKHISLSMLCAAKQSMFFMLPLSSMALVSLTPPCRATCYRYEHHLVVALRREILARNCIKISHRWSPVGPQFVLLHPIF